MFLEDEDWIVKHKEKQIYLMQDHKWAFIVWECARINRTLQENAYLVHVDTHLDDVPELVNNQKVLSAQTINELFEIAHFKQDEDSFELELRKDNFIIPSFLRGTIQDILYVSNSENSREAEQKEITVADIYEEKKKKDLSTSSYDFTLTNCYDHIKGQDKSITRIMGVEGLLNNTVSFKENQMKILDLDLDYFNNSNLFQTADLKNEEIIRSNLSNLKDYTDWDLITIALSPDYCGEHKDCMYLVELFLETFNLSAKDFFPWNKETLHIT